MGFTLSIGTSILRPRSKLPTIVQAFPDSIVLETDAPDQKPASIPGDLNPLTALLEVAAEVARLASRSLEETLEQSSKKALRLFGKFTAH